MWIVFDFVRTSLLRSKKLYFLTRISKNASFWLLLLKKTYKKKVDFLTKTVDQTLWKMPIFFTLLEFPFSGLKSILYYPKYQKMFLSCFVYSQKKTCKKKVKFLQKPCTNPFAKCTFFLILLEINFSGVKSIFYFPEYNKLFLSGFFFLQKKSM